MTLQEIVKDWLEKNKKDGLANADMNCACEKDDLMPCGEPSINCIAGMKVPCDPETCPEGGGCGFHIDPTEKK